MLRLFILFFCISLSACSNIDVEGLDVKDKNITSEKILTFSNKNSFQLAYRTNNFVPPARTFNDTIYNGGYFTHSNLRSDGEYSVGNISLEELVPDSQLANMLNSEGEIIISDTLYKVTKDGTFYTGINNKKDLDYYVSNLDLINEVFMGDDLYRYKDVYRYDTYKGIDFTRVDNTFNNNESDISYLRSYTQEMFQDVDVHDFKETNPHPENFISKQWAKWGGRISNVYDLSSTRRLNAEVYNYNNVFAHSIGITAKVQKKMWYRGWAKLKYWKEDELRIGFQDVLISTDIKDFHVKVPDFFYVRNTETESQIFERCKRIVYYKNNQKYNTPQSHIINGSFNYYGGMSRFSAYPYMTLFSGTKIYEFHPNFWGKNGEDRTEINFRFDKGFNTIIVGAKNISPYAPAFNNGNSGLLDFVKNNIVIDSNNSVSKDLLKGTFYAAVKYEGRWYGLKMNW